MKRAILAVMTLLFASLACSIRFGHDTLPVMTPTQAVVMTAQPEPTITNIVQQSATVTALRSLNVRAGPGENKKVIGWLYAGNEIQLTGECDSGWARIEWDGSAAWVNSDYLSDNLCKQ